MPQPRSPNAKMAANRRHFLRKVEYAKELIYSDERKRTVRPEKLHDSYVRAALWLLDEYRIPHNIGDTAKESSTEQTRKSVNAIISDLQLDQDLEDELSQSDDATVELNEEWRQRANAYVLRIRNIIGQADVKGRLQERLYNALEKLQSEINRRRTPTEIGTELWLNLTIAISQGARNLEPAVRLLGRLVGPIAAAGRILVHDRKPALPAPENLGLTDLEKPVVDEESAPIA